MAPAEITTRFLAFPVVMVAALFGSAGRWDLPFFWGYVGVLLGYVLVAGVFVMDKDLREERLRPGAGGKDRHLRRVALPFLVAHWVVAGLDVGRLHFSDTIPPSAQIAGLIGLAAALGLATWAVGVNRFFSPVVRIQRERGHHLITAKPLSVRASSGLRGQPLLQLLRLARPGLVVGDGAGGRYGGPDPAPHRPRGPLPPRGAGGVSGLRETGSVPTVAWDLVEEGVRG